MRYSRVQFDERRSMNGNLADDKLITQGQVDEEEICHILMKEKSIDDVITSGVTYVLNVIYNIQLGYKLQLISEFSDLNKNVT